MPHITPAQTRRLLDAIDARTDQFRRSVGASAGNALVFLSFIWLPRLPGADDVFGGLSSSEGAALAIPPTVCIVAGLVAYRWVGTQHWLYRAIDACELCASAAFPTLFPLLDVHTTNMAGVFFIVAAAFWGQAKPGRAPLFGGLLLLLGLLPVAVRLILWEPALAARSALFLAAAVAAFVTSVRAQHARVRAELRRDALREEARTARVARERRRIEAELTASVGGQLQLLAVELARAGLPEAAAARQVGEQVSELVFPALQPVPLVELSELTLSRCRALCPGVRLVHTAASALPPPSLVSPASSRAALRIAQELVRNAVVHGRARLIEVALRASAAELTLIVSDDGVGMSLEVASAATGGLHNAKIWAAESGGAVRVDRSDGFSTSIVVTLRHPPGG